MNTNQPVRIGIVTVSDRASKGIYQDLGGLFHVGPGDGKRQQELNHFIIGKPCQAMLHEPCPEALSMPVVMRVVSSHTANTLGVCPVSPLISPATGMWS